MRLPLFVLLGGIVVLFLWAYLSRTTVDAPVAVNIAKSLQPVMATHDPTNLGSMDATASRPQEEIIALRKEVATLADMVSILKRQGDGRRNITLPQEEEAASGGPHKDNAARDKAEHERQKQMNIIEDNFWQEPVDSTWSSKSIEAVEDVLAKSEIPQGLLRSIECRSSTCRAEIAENGIGDLNKRIQLFIHQLPDTLSSVIANQIESGDGNKIMVLYISAGTNEDNKS